MTAQELRAKFNDTFGLNAWPKTYNVDAETYANVCQLVFTNCPVRYQWDEDTEAITISIGPHKGIMFKNVELLLVKEATK